MKKSDHGFTLIELMIVIAIIGILGTSLYPSMSNYFLRAKVSGQLQQLRSIRTALEAYSIDIGRYPITNGWENEYGCWNGTPLYNQKDKWIPGLVDGGYIPHLPNGNLGSSGACNDGLFIYNSSGGDCFKLLAHGGDVAKTIKLSQPKLVDWLRDGGSLATLELDDGYTPWAYGFWTDGCEGY